MAEMKAELPEQHEGFILAISKGSDDKLQLWFSTPDRGADYLIATQDEFLSFARALIEKAEKVKTPEQFDEDKILEAARTHLWTDDEMTRIGIWLLQQAPQAKEAENAKHIK